MKFLRILDNSKITPILLGIILLLHLGAFTYRTIIGPAETADSEGYFLCAKNAYEGNGFQYNIPGEPYQEEFVATRTPGYPAIILALGQSKVAVMGFQVLLSLTTIWLCILFLKKFNFSPLTQNILLLGFLFTPAQVIYATTLMSEIPFQFFLVNLFLSVILFIKTNKIKWLVFSVLALSIGFLIKPILYPFTFIFLIAGTIYLIRKWKLVCLPLPFIPFLVVIALASWNYTRTGAFEVSSIQATNLLNYNGKMILYQADGHERGDFVIDSLETEAVKITDFSERQNFRSRETRKIFLNHPFIAAFQFVKGCGSFFLDPGRFDWITYLGLENKNGFMFSTNDSKTGAILNIIRSTPLPIWVILLIVFIFNIVKLFLFGVYILKKSQTRYVKIILSTGILYILAITGSLGVSRYALPIVPLLLIGTALGAATLKNGENK